MKAILARTPYKIVRRGKDNRFSAIEEAIEGLKGRGFNPPLIVDGGANVGDFSRFCLTTFPNSNVHAIEPQPGCTTTLKQLREQVGERFVVHSVALCSPEQDSSSLRLVSDNLFMSTGAHIASEAEHSVVSVAVPCTALDQLLKMEMLSKGIKGSLLKLDLQGYELNALRGAIESLAISELVSFLARQGFELHDIASIYARPRDNRARQGDFIFVRTGSPLAADNAWS